MTERTFLAVNRAALIVKPKRPFFNWANSLEGPSLNPDEPLYDPPIYLVEEVEFSPDPGPALQKHHKAIFEHELAAWYLDETAWPPTRDLATFNEWFDVELRSLLVDLSDYQLEVEELGA